MRPAAKDAGRRRPVRTVLVLATLAALALSPAAGASNSLIGGLLASVKDVVTAAPAPRPAPAPAQAGTEPPPAAQPPARRGAGLSCPGTASRPFLRWLDPAAYTLLPGGSFEGSLAWEAGAARLVPGNEPWQVHSRGDRSALLLPAGASVTSPPVCVGLGHPTIRFFAAGGGRGSWLRVEALYGTALGSGRHTVALLPPRASWSPTLPLLFLGNVLGLTELEGLTTTVRFRFTALGNAPWQIDDVYVDPWKID